MAKKKYKMSEAELLDHKIVKLLLRRFNLCDGCFPAWRSINKAFDMAPSLDYFFDLYCGKKVAGLVKGKVIKIGKGFYHPKCKKMLNKLERDK
jgi:hypothetical protein